VYIDVCHIMLDVLQYWPCEITQFVV